MRMNSNTFNQDLIQNSSENFDQKSMQKRKQIQMSSGYRSTPNKPKSLEWNKASA